MASKWKRSTMGLCFTLGTGFLCALYLIWGSYFFERTATFSEGMETCFERLRWSYVSSLLGDNGGYPDSSFFKNTEACFSEVVFYMEKNFSTSLVKDFAPVNSLVMGVHWFHKDLLGGKNKIFQKGQFDKLENARRGIVNRLQSERKRQGRYMDVARKLFFAVWGMALLFFSFGLFVNRKKSTRAEMEKKSVQPDVKRTERKQKEVDSDWKKNSFAGGTQGHPQKGKRRLLKGKKKEVLRELSSWQNE